MASLNRVSTSSSLDFIDTKVDEIPCNGCDTVNRIKITRCGLKSIPKGLLSFKNLRNLDLSENMFEIFKVHKFSSLSNLQILDLSLNNIIKIESYIPGSLTTLDLSYNPNLDFNEIYNLEMPSLETLKVASCRIKRFPKSKPAWAGTIKNFVLDGNHIKAFGNVFDNLPVLEELSLFGNDFEELNFPKNVQIKSLNMGLNDIKKITGKLDVQSLILTKNCFCKFPTNLLEFNGLKYLSLKDSGISDNIDFVLPQDLTILDLSFNNIKSLSVNFVQSCSNLTFLDISHNHLKTIPDSFPPNLRLSQLYLDNNVLVNIPETLMKSKTLEKINLSHNKLKSLPFFQFPQLRDFNVSFNQLTEITDSFSNSTFLISFDVSYNLLTDLPSSLTSPRRLLDLFLNHNKFVTVPKCILSFASLSRLFLSGNSLTSLPSSFNSFFFLKTLDISNNHFTTLPKSICRLPALKYFSISHNLIESIPEDFTFPKSIILLDLSYNLLRSFNGISLPSIVSLSLDNNLIESFSISDAQNINFLSISGNKLNCSLSDVLKNVNESKKFEFLEIYDNKLTNYEHQCDSLHIISDENISSKGKYGIGYSGTVGIRNSMEDTISISSDDSLSSFAIFDGHAGSNSSKIASLFILSEIRNRIERPLHFRDCFIDIEEKLYEKNVNDGCTAAVAYIHKERCCVAGVGDTRILLFKKDGCERMTIDHKPLLKSEYKRLKRASVGVSIDGRVKKKLAVGRTLGDFWCGEGLFESPGIINFPITENDLGIVIACDGVWDVLDDEDVYNIFMSSKDSQDAATTIRNSAFSLGSADNISVIVVHFHPEKPGIHYDNSVERIPIVEENEEEEKNLIPIPQMHNRRRRR